MKEKLKAFFEEQKIEYFSVLPLSECRLTKPHLLKKTGISSGAAVIYLLPYYTGECENISCYAASRDYHLLLKTVGQGLAELLRGELGARAAAFGDQSPIDERDAAARAGLGIIGDNGLIINEKYGSYVFIGEVITDADSALLDAQAPTRVEFCEHCGACKEACPIGKTGTCLSALTQKKGELSKEEREVIKEYGSAWGPIHGAEDGVGDVLNGNVHVFHQAGVVFQLLHQVVGDLVGIAVKQADPGNGGLPCDGAHQVRKTVFPVKVKSVSGGILGDEVQFLYADGL